MRTYPCHININEAEGYVFTTGMEFKTFISAVPDKIEGFLLLKGSPLNAQFDRHTYWEYVSQEELEAFLQEDVYNYGDFCWVDFADERKLKNLTDENIAELLFATHLKRPLNTVFVDALSNSYLYLCHDDDYWVKVYMKNVRNYKFVIEQKIREIFMGRKKSLSPIPQDMLDELYNYFIGGAVFDFENCTVSSIHTGVRIFPARNLGFRADDIHSELDRQRNIAGTGKYLEYNPKTKKWALI